MLVLDAAVADATDSAVARIADLLTHPDDLANKLGVLRRRFAAEKANIDAQLKTLVESQLDDARRGVDTLLNSKEQTELVSANLEKIDSLCAEAQNTVKNYARIKKISRTHQNFVATKEIVEQFQSLNEQIVRINGLLNKDSEVIDGPAENLLLIHHEIFQLESFKNSTLQRSKGGSADVVSTLQNYFRKVDKLVEEFDSYMWKLAKAVLDLTKSGRISTIVRMVKIIETEEKADEAAATQFITAPNNDPCQDKLYQRQPKSYRIRFFDALRDTLRRNFDAIYEQHKSEFSELLTALNFVTDDLTIIHDDLAPRLPRRYNTFHFFVLEYHRNIYDTINRVIQGSMEAGAILQLLRWVRNYYEDMSARLGVGEELLEPKLLDGKEEQLIVEYIKLIRNKLAEWMGNLLQSETREFFQRNSYPDSDPVNGNYFMNASIIMFQMVNQQVNIVSASSRGKLMYDVVCECTAALDEFHRAWTKILDSEYQKFFEKSAELAEGLPEYLMALANDAFRSREFSEDIITRIDGMVDDEYKEKVKRKLDGTLDGFMKLATRTNTVLIDIVLSEIKPALIQMHTNAWYEGDPIRPIIATLEDYCNDFQQHLCEYLFTKLTADLLDRFVAVHIESFRNKGAKFKFPGCIERLKSDLEKGREFFLKYKPPKRVNQSFDAIEKLVAFVCSTGGLAFLDFWSLYNPYRDLPISFVEELIEKRDDLDKSAKKELIENCKNKVTEESAKRKEPITPTVFSKINVGKEHK